MALLALLSQWTANELLTPWLCGAHPPWLARGAAILTTVVALVLATAVEEVSYRRWRRHADGGAPAASRFLALAGVVLAVACLLAIVTRGAAVFVTDVCVTATED